MITEKTNSCRYFNGKDCTITGCKFFLCEPCLAYRDKSEPKVDHVSRIIDPIYTQETDI